MLNIQAALDPRLWEIIESAYHAGNYTSAILDSIHFLGELIRERSGLSSDGTALAGDAFGGINPKLKVTPLQTESDRNIQKGTEAILRGVYQSIRNPRSHEKRGDTVEDAEAIILFINYLVRVIGKAKSPFELEAFLDRVFDTSFLPDNRYAELLVREIPASKRWDTLVAIWRLKESRGKGDKLRVFMDALLPTLPLEEMTSFYGIVSEELETTNDDSTVRFHSATCPE
jgi:uncharacterized protein (TIGR02391 family)